MTTHGHGTWTIPTPPADVLAVRDQRDGGSSLWVWLPREPGNPAGWAVFTTDGHTPYRQTTGRWPWHQVFTYSNTVTDATTEAIHLGLSRKGTIRAD